jgi:hypothetical protein
MRLALDENKMSMGYIQRENWQGKICYIIYVWKRRTCYSKNLLNVNRRIFGSFWNVVNAKMIVFNLKDTRFSFGMFLSNFCFSNG